jgi:hypothetical protein
MMATLLHAGTPKPKANSVVPLWCFKKFLALIITYKLFVKA